MKKEKTDIYRKKYEKMKDDFLNKCGTMNKDIHNAKDKDINKVIIKINLYLTKNLAEIYDFTNQVIKDWKKESIKYKNKK